MNDAAAMDTDHLGSLDLAQICALWRAAEGAWRESPDAHCAVARRLLALGEPLLAFDVVSAGLARWPGDDRLKILEGLALARSGATERALRIMSDLYDAGRRDEETIGILARTHKDLALESSAPGDHLEQSRALYVESFRLHGGYWSGINAATLAFLLDDRDEAKRLASAVAARCRSEIDGLSADAPDAYWPYATLGEASLLLGHVQDAQAFYAKASQVPHAGWGNLASTRRNATLLLVHAGLPAGLLQACLPRPRVVVFTGHMIDAASRPTPRFPLQREADVAHALAEIVARRGVHIAYASAACGGDLLFLEAVLQAGGEINIVLPCEPESFLRNSVDARPGDWHARFERVLARAASVVLAAQESTGDVFLGYANLLMFGLAKTRARQIDGELGALALWDGASGAAGGTGSAVALWRDCGQEVQAIDPASLVVTTLPPTRCGAFAQWQSSVLATRDDKTRALVSMLFGDAVGFSKLGEEQIPLFVHHFLGGIADVIGRGDDGPRVRNTWGDAIYLAFEDVRAAGLAALDISERVTRTDWALLGLPATLNIRIGLHSGPAYPIVDPVIGQFSYTGVHVSRAARIEPITPPGTVYASQAFAALAEAVGVEEFTCEYVGRTSMAKHYGDFPTYLVRRARR